MAATPASTPFTPGRGLDYEPLWHHLLQIVRTTDPDISVPTPRNEHLPGYVLESLGSIALVLNAALRSFYPLRDVHKGAILSYIQHVFAWIDSSDASAAAVLGSDHLHPSSRPVPPSGSSGHDVAGTALSPARQKALSLANQAERVDPRRWSFLRRFVNDAREVRAAMQQTSDPDIVNEDREVLNVRINEFLSLLKRMRTKLHSLFANLSTASLEPEDTADVIIEALDRLATGEACTRDEAVTYLVLCLPALDSHPDRSRDNRDLEHHFAKQLRREYRGDAPARFLRFVDKVIRHYTKSDQNRDFFDSYLKGTSLVQSSGTGKTRLVLELGKRAPLLYVCVRRKGLYGRSSVKNGFPLAEENLYEYFRDATLTSTASCDLQVAAFLAAWFETLYSRLRVCATAQQKYDALAQLNDYGGPGISQRQPFFNAVLQQARLKLSSAASIPRASTAESDVFTEYLDDAVCRLGAQLSLIREWLWDQHKSDYQVLGIDCPPVFVAFDECVELIVPKPGRKTEDHQLNSLRRAWHHMLELEAKKNTETFWLVLLSTNTGAAELIVPQNLQGSARARDKEPLPIFVGLGFDILRGEQPVLTSPLDVFDTRHVRSYGRPLWASLPLDTFWEMAQFKLLGAKPFSSTESEVCYNLLAARLSLQFIPTHLGDAALFSEQKTLATKSVDRHMRILQQVVDHTSLVISAPSEPVLAIAAALIMLKDTSQHCDCAPCPPPNYAAVIDTFTTQSLSTLGPDFLKGAHGEFMARLAMMAAWDASKLDLQQRQRQHWDQDNQMDAASIVSRAVPLQDFLEQVATLDHQGTSVVTNAIDNVCNTVRHRLAGYTTSSCGAPVEDDVGAWLNFTHFDALPEGISCISPDYLWYCWKRGVALQMAHGQAGVDGIIPVFVGNLSQKFRTPVSSSSDADAGTAAVADEDGEIDEAQAARQMTYIAWEAKYRDEAMSLTEARQPSRAGPTLLPAACDVGADAGTATDADAQTEFERTEVAPLTRAALVTVIADLGTKQAFAASRSLGPRAEIVRTMGGKSTFVRLWIRGIEDPRAYPCFDALGIREKMSKLLQTVRLSPTYEEENMILSPVWRSGARPESRSRVIEGPLQSLPWSSPSMPEAALEDDNHLDEPMDL